MNKLCCIGLSLAARIISTYTMSLSILMINVMMSSFFSRATDEDFFDSIEAWGLLGLNWAQVVRHSQIQRKAQATMIAFIVFTLSFLVASAYLAFGSISRKPKCAVPWMYLQMISIIDQSVALSIHLTHGPQYDVYDKSIWYIPVSSVYLLMCAYFWMVVQGARREWSNVGEESCNTLDLGPTLQVPPVTSNDGPKTPSFLSQNFTLFESPKPPILPK